MVDKRIQVMEQKMSNDASQAAIEDDRRRREADAVKKLFATLCRAIRQ